MARGMILFFVMVLGSSAMALSDVEKCARKADRLVAKQYPNVDVRRDDFKNTTPGSYYQEYTGIYSIGGRQYVVEFYSPFICDRLEITAVR